MIKIFGVNKQQAKQQIEAFFLRLGNKASFFDEKNFVQARIGEAFVGFTFDDANEILSAQALIYRFRDVPKNKILDQVFAAENESNNGGGEIVFDDEARTLFLQKKFIEKIADEQFYKQINVLAQASLLWSGDIFARAAERANSQI